MLVVKFIGILNKMIVQLIVYAGVSYFSVSYLEFQGVVFWKLK